MQAQPEDLQFDYKYGFSKPENYSFKAEKGLSEEIVRNISLRKNEPDWMTEFRVKAYKIFLEKKMPEWGGDLSKINFDSYYYYIKPVKDRADSWADLPKEIKDTYDKIGIPEAEKKYLSGVSAQYESEVVYESVTKLLTDQGVLFMDCDSGLKKHPEIFKKYFSTVIPPHDNKFAALNSAVWSGGSFVYVPEGVHVTLPLQAYFRINAQNVGQFERTLIIAEEGSYVHYIEGCLPAGEQVSLGDSWANIEGIKPGDIVATHTGYLSKVKAIMTRKYKGNMYTIHPLSPFNKVSLTSEHPVWAIKRESALIKRKLRTNWLAEVDSKKLRSAKPEFIPISQLQKGDFVLFPKIKNTQITSVNPLSDEQIEFLGLYLAEGWAYYHEKLKQYLVTLTFSEKEVEYIERTAELITLLTGKKAIFTKEVKKHAVNIMVYGKSLYDLCIEHCGKYAQHKKLSGDLMNLSPKKIELLFWSYFKGDGNVCIKRNNSTLYRAATASQTLAIQFQELLGRLGTFASIQFRKGGEDIILGRNIVRKDQYILAFTSPKGWSEIRETEDYFIVPIKKIESREYDDYVFNLEVDGNNSYLVKGIAVHNCTAPIYQTGEDSLHSAVVEIIVKKGARVRYTTVQNWSNNVYNLVTKRTRVEEKGFMEWIDCNIGSQLTMKYPSCYLMGDGARGEVLSIAFAGAGQHQDAGAKMFHFAPNTSSRIVSKSISKGGGRTSYRGLVQVRPGAKNSSVYVSCDALILDPESRSDTYPYMKIKESETNVQHEATVEKLGEEKIFYLTSRGISKNEAEGMLVNGFIEPIAREIPLEYSIELNRLINLEMAGSVG